jgi:CheY-like chemotaxis protein
MEAVQRHWEGYGQRAANFRATKRGSIGAVRTERLSGAPPRLKRALRGMGPGLVKLILLEDDPLILLCTQDALAEAGFEVLPAISGAEALALLADSPDCAVMMLDVRLADPMDGWEVARRARSLRPHIAIIYTTTADSPAYDRECVPQSILLQKPYSLDRAVSVARKACQMVE